MGGRARQRAAAADQFVATDALRRIAFELRAMAGDAPIGIDLRTARRVSAAGRQPAAVRRNRKEAGEFLLARGRAKTV
jgi:hypothetical protein